MIPRAGWNPYLDWLRGIAALLVLVGHLRVAHFANWYELEETSRHAANFVLFSITRLGHEGVIVFFVLSGFLVGGQALQRRLAGTFSFGDYMAARLARLYAVLLPVLVLTALVDALAGRWTGEANGLRAFLVNAFFLQNMLGPPYGSNVPLWTLALEWWFYSTLGLALLVSDPRARTAYRALALGVLAAILAALAWGGHIVLAMFPLWLLGAAISLAPAGRAGLPTIVFGIALLVVAMGVSTVRQDGLGDAAVAIASAVFIQFARGAPLPRRGAIVAAGAFLAAISYSLYAMHFPLVTALYELVHPQRVRQAGLLDWLRLAGFGAMVVLACVAFHFAFERRTPALRAWLGRAFR